MRNKKIIIYILIFSIFFAISFSSALAIFKERELSFKNLVWDGTIASSYKSGDGSKEFPYIISDGRELAYLSLKLEEEDYSDTYFKLSKDIILNDGVFSYEENNILYEVNDNVYNLKENDNNLYIDEEIKDYINIFPSLKNFKGKLDGNNKHIYGLYLTGDNKVGLFDNLQGKITNLNIINSLSLGGYETSILASNSKGSNISNLLIDGYAIGSTPKEETKEIEINNAFVYLEEIIDLTEYLPNEFGYENVIISGNYNYNDDLTINGEVFNNGLFNLNLTDLELILNIDSEDTEEIELSNVEVTFTEIKGTTAPLIASSKNDTINNVSIYTNVNGNYLSSGVIAQAKDINLNNILSESKVYSNNMSAGVIGYIYDGDNTINHVYNKTNVEGLKTGSLISFVNNSNVEINNAYTETEDFVINEVLMSEVDILNSYTSGGENTEYGATNNIFLTEELTQELFYDDILFDDNIWKYENVHMIKDYNYLNPVIINYKENTYDNNKEYTTKVFDNEDVNFNINFKTNFNNVKTIEYYLANDYIEDLELIEYLPYEEDILIDEEGENILYLKVEIGSTTKYINTPVIVLDKTKPTLSININDHKFKILNEEFDKTNISDNFNVILNASDNLSDLKSVKYFITDEELTKTDLKDKTFQTYNDEITIDETGTYIVYAKATDKAGNTKYVSSNILYYDGFNLTYFNIGENNVYENIYNIDKNSKVKYNFTYEEENTSLNDASYFITSNNKLNNNVKLYLIDNINNKSYMHVINENTNYEEDSNFYYNFDNFTLIGSTSNSVLNNKVNENINDNYTLIIDYKDSNIKEDVINNKISLTIKNDEEVLISTLKNNKSYNVYNNNINSNIDLTLNYTFDEIILNSNSVYEVDILSNVEFDNNIINTNYEYHNNYIKINIESDNKLLRESLKNIKFKVNGKYYYFNYNNDVVIKIDDTFKLNILTSELNNMLPEGDYTLNITSFVGPFRNKIIDETNVYKINARVTKEKIKESLDIKLNKNILSKDNDDKLKITTSNNNVYMSLYEKTKQDPLDQEYTLIDLKDYVDNSLTKHIDDVYHFDKTLNLKLNNFNFNSYKLVFSLYEENKKVEEVSKYFIFK